MRAEKDIQNLPCGRPASTRPLLWLCPDNRTQRRLLTLRYDLQCFRIQSQQPQYSGTQPYSPPTHYKEKEPAIAVILSLVVILGSGHIYAGKVGKGIGLILGAFGCIGLIYGGFFSMGIFWDIGPFIAMMVIGGIGALVLALYAHIDAYKTAQNYNQFLRTHGRPPTSRDNW